MKPTIAGKDIFPQLSDDLKAKINSLPTGKVLAVFMRNVSTDDNKVQVEFAEKINLSTQPRSALAAFNPGDDRFSSGARRTWVTSDRKHAENMFGVSIKEGEAFAEIGKILGPAQANGSQSFRVQVQEMLESDFTDSQRDYADNYLKIIPSTGAYFYATNGERVGAQTRLVIIDNEWSEEEGKYIEGDVKHQLIEGEYKLPHQAGQAVSGTSVLKSAGTTVVG